MFIQDQLFAGALYLIGAILVFRFARSKGAHPAVYTLLAIFYPVAYLIAGTWVWMQDMKS
jgi:hypothetical protein